MPVAVAALDHAAGAPSRPAVGALTYGALAAGLRAGATDLRDRGVRAGDLVAVALSDPAAALTAVLAADLIGATPLVGEPRWSPAQWRSVRAAVRPALVVDSPLRTDAAPLVDWRQPRPDDAAWAGFSSGSTGRPRAVVRSRASWTGSFAHVSRLAGIAPGTVVAVPGPLSSSLYCFGAIHALATGASVTTEPAAADVAHLVPAQLDGSRVPSALVGGASVAWRPGVVGYYGAVELSFVAADTDGSGLRPFPSVEIEVRPLTTGLGEVWVRSPWLSAGYLAGDGPLRTDGAGWATVGDLATLPYDGVLHLRGRGDGAVQTGAATVLPEDVEAVLRAVPGVADVVVVGTPHARLGAVVTAVIEGSPGRQALVMAARRRLDPAQRPRRWLAVERLPRTPSGKPARALVSAGLLAGTLPTGPV